MVVVGFVATIVGLAEWADGKWEYFNDQGIFALATLTVVAGGLLLHEAVMFVWWGRDRRYAEMLGTLNRGFSHIHDLLDVNHDGSRDLSDAKIACERMCNSIAATLSHVTNSPVSATVKMLLFDTDQNDLYASTLARDQNQHISRAHNDRPHEITHYVSLNTDFSMLFERLTSPKPDVFYRNNLPWEYFRGRYDNTSFDLYGHPSRNVLLLLRRWSLPYKSTLIVPIAPNNMERRDGTDLIGFLCVDSPSLYAFRYRYDVELALGIAEGLYNFLDKALREEEARGQRKLIWQDICTE